MNTKPFLNTFLVTLSLLLFLGCKKNDLVPPPLSASFEIREVIWDPDFWNKATYDTDSTSTAEVEFIAKEPETDGITYEWKIGSDVRIFTGKKFSLDMRTSPTDEITVQLTVIKKDLITGVEKERKTNLRIFYIRRTPQVFGSFEGYFDGNPTKTIVIIKGENYKNPDYYNYEGIYFSSNNIPTFRLFSPCLWSEHLVLNKIIYFDYSTTYNPEANPYLRNPKGTVSVKSDGKTILIDLEAKDAITLQKVSIKFTGTKL